MDMNKDQKQQGDIWIQKVEALPKDCKHITHSRGSAVLGEGETHGHYHEIIDKGVCVMEAPDGRRFAVNSTDHPVKITHQEHKPFTLDPGMYEFGNVREYDYFQEMEHKVID